MDKVSVIIPAFNEEKQIRRVLSAVVESSLFNEVIVVDDGSTDKTFQRAKEEGAKVIHFQKNGGKGAAMMAGFRAATGEVIVFLDADLIGLKKEHLMSLIEPVFSGKAEMTIGDFRGGNIITFIGQTLTPAISGQRAILKERFKDLDLEAVGYGAELALNKYAKKQKLRVKRVTLNGLNQVLAEQKMGFFGLWLRIFKYLDIVKQLFSD